MQRFVFGRLQSTFVVTAASLLASVTFAALASGAEFNPTAQERIVPADAELELVFADADFSEGPAPAADGSILFSDIGDRILRFDPQSGETTVYRQPSGKANGLMFDAEGRLVACEGANGGARRISITERDGTVRTLADRYGGRRFNSPNDLAVHPNGRVYFTDPRYVGDEPRELDFQGVFFIDRDGTVELATRDVEQPNGILISPDGNTVYLADNSSRPQGNHHLLALRVADDGTLAGKRVLHDFGPNRRGIDGMTLDAEGNIYATAGSGEAGGIYVFGPDGAHLAFLPTPGVPTNCVFGVGEEKQTLYITAGAPEGDRFGLYRIRLTKPGYHLYSPDSNSAPRSQ